MNIIELYATGMNEFCTNFVPVKIYIIEKWRDVVWDVECDYWEIYIKYVHNNDK